MSLDLLLDANDGPVLAGIAWLLTYLLHSTLLLGGTWVLLRFWHSAGDALQEFLWKFALLGGLASATLQVFGGIETAGATVALRPVGAEVASAMPDISGEGSAFGLLSVGDTAAPQPGPGQESLFGLLNANASTSIEPGLALNKVVPFDVPPEAISSGMAPSDLLWLALAALALAAPTLWAYRRTRRMLANRTAVAGSAANTELAQICADAGIKRRVRLTQSAHIPAPVSLGILRWEICVPPRALAGLKPAERRAMLAHELAHLVRRDPVWLAFCRTLETWLFLQPLNRVARRRLQEIAEYRCDAWAAQVGQDGGINLARCLAEVAEWLLPSQPQTTGYAAMAEQPSHLSRRIRRLLEPQSVDRSARFAPWFAAALLVPLTFAAPSVSARALAESAGVLLAPEPLPLEPAVAALKNELGALDAEIKDLTHRIAQSQDASEYQDTLDLLERKAASLREQFSLPMTSQE